MFLSLTLATAWAFCSAPVAPPPVTPASGSAPYILNLKPNAEGRVCITVPRIEKQKILVATAIMVPGGGTIVRQVEEEADILKFVAVDLKHLKDLKIYDNTGKEVALKTVEKRLDEGGVFVASSDGKAVDAQYMRLFHADTLILVSPELVPRAEGGIKVAGGFRPMPLPPELTRSAPVEKLPPALMAPANVFKPLHIPEVLPTPKLISSVPKQ